MQRGEKVDRIVSFRGCISPPNRHEELTTGELIGEYISVTLVWRLGGSSCAGRSETRGSNQRQADPHSPHHVKVSLAIGATTSLIKWVALKWALTHSAHMMLNVEEGRQENGHKT